jgi:hypothetical protein
MRRSNRDTEKIFIMVRRISGSKREEDGSWRNCVMMNFTACILHRILLR